MNKQNYFVLAGVMLASILAPSAIGSTLVSTQQQVEQANQCRAVTSRLDRLACFDRVFNTQVVPVEARDNQSQKPLQWRRAMIAAQQSAPQSWSLTEKGEGRGSSAWITLRASNISTSFRGGEQPLLMLSCIDNLSRVELMLPEPIEDGRMKLTFPNGQTQYWRNGDLGVVLSSSRGLPAIRLMKALSTEDRLTIRSNSQYVDGLTFDTQPLPETLGALRSRCGW
ncbi:type VI secretion system-associated protein VasI [Salinivibrio sp. ES.052]|uniref:type VI secretion system-associated protein VasI n=1 Tax=Salinivibrio sp. ES.052 TaxID=1882823 RepID=UPI00092B27F2|nr:type VI secretion system-associated protein VasI [Salinivibrio sp. ES.052]SIO32242.1 type VI secretion system protein VasI [Salinivibrio sp. ES.052]